MKIELKYSKSKVNLDLSEYMNVQEILPRKMEKTGDVEKAVRKSLEQPIGKPRLIEMAAPGMRVAIMASDITRPVPSYKILPAIVEALNEAGVQDEDITVIFGMGIHRKHTPEEQEQLIGSDLYKRIKCVDSSQDEFVYLGKTRFGTPIHLAKSYLEADFKIATGNIEYHYFAGYSGGAKAVMPGAANRESIAHNHKLQLLEGSESGRMDGNPVREDIEEVGKLTGLDYIVNVVLDEKKQIAHVVAGDPIQAHREGAQFLDRHYRIGIDRLADVVIVSSGGYPKDLNLYQAQKALDNAKHAVREGGDIVMISACSEGYGSKTFEQWFKEAHSPDQVIERLQRGFVLGGHKAAAISRVLKKCTVHLYSEMTFDDLHHPFFDVVTDLDDLMKQLKEKHGSQANVLVMPVGSSTLPYLE